jgi:two-component system response regulator AtoC
MDLAQNKSPIAIATRSDSTVLLVGPTGSGKTRLAKQIHEAGPRKLRPFVTVNLASLHEGTIESELFGHERGAFTGADSKRVGRLEAASGGTVFLDEIGELSLRLQARLLEFLQSRTITPVGGNREVSLDVRVIVATHRNLSELIKKGLFREDLFHRIRVITIDLKPISEREEEFDELVHKCLEEVCILTKRKIFRLSEPVVERLECHTWPGNFRELRNVLEYAVLSSQNEEVVLDDLPHWFVQQSLCSSPEEARSLGTTEFTLSLDYQKAITGFEKEYLNRALARFRGRVNQTARQIGMNKTTLIRRMRVYGLEKGGGEIYRSAQTP